MKRYNLMITLFIIFIIVFSGIYINASNLEMGLEKNQIENNCSNNKYGLFKTNVAEEEVYQLINLSRITSMRFETRERDEQRITKLFMYFDHKIYYNESLPNRDSYTFFSPGLTSEKKHRFFKEFVEFMEGDEILWDISSLDWINIDFFRMKYPTYEISDLIN